MRIPKAINTLAITYPPKPDSQSALFLEKGYLMEFFLIGHDKKKMVSLFFEPGEFVIACHPHSEFQSLDDVVSKMFSYGAVIRLLKNRAEVPDIYRFIREQYYKKAAARVHSLQSMTSQERFEELRQKQPWVLELAEPEHIASYLGISCSILEMLKKGKP